VRRRSPVRTALAVLAVLAPAPAAFGFELLRSSGRTCSADDNLRWSPARVAVDTTDLGESRRGLGEEALAAWREVLGARLQLVSGAGRPCTADGVTTLAFTENDCMGNPFAGDTLAITVTSWVGNRITDADVSFNPAVTLTNSAFRQVAMHEIGHVIGLDHSDACGESGRGTLMNSRLVETFDRPQADDVDGALFVYGGGGGDVGVPEGANGCAVGEPFAAAWPLAMALALLALATAARRRPAPATARRDRHLENVPPSSKIE
jgi:hypothetical protein